MTRGYRLRSEDWRWIVANLALYKKYPKELADTGGLSGANRRQSQGLVSLCERLIRTSLVRPQDRPTLLRMLLVARQKCDQRSRGHINAESRSIDKFLERLSRFDWEALDNPDESTYDPTRLWRGFRRTETELYYLLVHSDSRVMCSCPEGYEALEPGATLTLVVDADEEDDGCCGPGDIYLIEVIRTRICVKDGAAAPDQPTKMFEGRIVTHPQRRERRPNDDEMSGIMCEDGSVLMLPSSPLSRYSQKVYEASLWCATDPGSAPRE
jgi:hypothetical protein